MTTALQKSPNGLLESFKVINHLFSGFRGAVEYHRFLQGFGHRSFDPNAPTVLEKLLAKVDRWITALFEGEILFSATWTIPETFEAHEALSALQTLLTDLEQNTSLVEDILRLKTQLTVKEDAQLLAATIARVTHARHLFLLGLADIGPLIGEPDAAQTAAAILPESGADIEVALGVFGYLSEAESLEEAFAIQLTEMAADLPGLLRTQAHETLLLLNYFDPDSVTFERVGILAHEQGRWEISGIEPREAGYWRARGISPEEVIAWRIGGIMTAFEASRWMNAGFSPSSATPWAEKGFAPPVASEWARGGYKPDTAAAYISKSIPLPSAIPGRKS